MLSFGISNPPAFPVRPFHASFVVAILVGFFAPATGSAASWQSVGTVVVPQYNYSFLAATPSGDLLATTFYSAQPSAPSSEIPALLIKNPTSSNPQVIELCKTSFNPQRGYGGIACDSFGNFFLSGDTGDPATCFVRKFKADGSPDTSFGTAGELRPQRRCLGMDILGEYLFLAVDWGLIQVYRVTTGEMIGQLPKATESVFLRDIAIDPRSMRIYGVAAGGVVVWENGTPWEPQKYAYRRITPDAGEVRSGEGISIDPPTQFALVTPILGNTLLEVGPEGVVNRTPITSASPSTHLVDSVLSFDGTTLFISDTIGKKIHILRRALSDQSGGDFTQATPTRPAEPTLPPAPTAAAAAAAPTPQVAWYSSYTAVVEAARRQELPMVVYFRRAGFAKCDEFENACLMTAQFAQRAQRFICVFEDIDANRLLAHRFGVFRVPHLALLDKRGETRATFTFTIKPDDVYRAMDSMP